MKLLVLATFMTLIVSSHQAPQFGQALGMMFGSAAKALGFDSETSSNVGRVVGEAGSGIEGTARGYAGSESALHYGEFGAGIGTGIGGVGGPQGAVVGAAAGFVAGGAVGGLKDGAQGMEDGLKQPQMGELVGK